MFGAPKLTKRTIHDTKCKKEYRNASINVSVICRNSPRENSTPLHQQEVISLPKVSTNFLEDVKWWVSGRRRVVRDPNNTPSVLNVDTLDSRKKESTWYSLSPESDNILHVKEEENGEHRNMSTSNTVFMNIIIVPRKCGRLLHKMKRTSNTSQPGRTWQRIQWLLYRYGVKGSQWTWSPGTSPVRMRDCSGDDVPSAKSVDFPNRVTVVRGSYKGRKKSTSHTNTNFGTQ